MRTAKKNLFGFGKSKVTYHRDVAKERRELIREAKQERARKLAEKRDRLKEESLDAKRAAIAERREEAERKKLKREADAMDRKIEKEMREKGYRNPIRGNLTDRAKRYRAQKANDPLKNCFACGRPNPDMVHHLTGNESDGEWYDLISACRSCNVIIANVMREAGIGKKTVQYNPAGGAKNLGQWMNAVMSMKGESDAMTVPQAVAMIRATSKNKRSEFASDIWAKRHSRSRSNPRNPEDAAEELSEAWHGRPASRATDVIERVHFHGVLADLGRLQEIKIRVSNRKAQAIRFDKDTRLCSSENGKQLYVVGGDQSLDLAALGIEGEESEKDLVLVGEAYSVVYVTAKEHLGKADKTPGPYEHVLGEDGGEAPMVVYDTLNDTVGFVGGTYFIDPTDYDGKHSAGIRN